MNADKTPTTDGLPVEFYKAFWDDISTHLLSALNFAFESGCLSITQRRGIIKLIPKKSIEPFYIKKNWRPITLLNTYRLQNCSRSYSKPYKNRSPKTDK